MDEARAVPNPAEGAPGDDSLWDLEFLRRLERLQVLTRRQVTGQQAGERRSRRRGEGVEFADFRNYTPGDDYRRVDWSAFARMERLFLKLYLEEQETDIHLLVDASRSMDWGRPNKFRLARQVAGALGYLGLAGYDRVDVSLMTDTVSQRLGPLRGRPSVWRLLQFLQGARAGGRGDLPGAVRALGRLRPAPGVAVLVTDGLSPLNDLMAGLSALQAARQDLTVVQILSPDELEPDLAGDLRLVDSETSRFQEVTVSEGLLREYDERLRAHMGAIAQFCSGRGIGHLQVPSTLPLADLVLHSLRRSGLVG